MGNRSMRSENRPTSISVALCTFNGSQFLEEQLSTINNQTILPNEIIICDDGSTDHTKTIVERFRTIAKMPVLFFTNDERMGYSRNFMKAASLCCGDLIAFCDQDDLWYTNKLQVSMQKFEDRRVLLTYHAVDLVDAEGRFLRTYTDRDPGAPLLPPLYGSPWVFGMGFTIMFRRCLKLGAELSELTFDQNIPDKPVSHDQWYTFLASAFGHIAYIDTPLAGYRQHSSNVVGALKPLDVPPKGIHERVRAQSDEYQRCSDASGTRAEILRLSCAYKRAPLRERALEGARKYDRLRELFSKRTQLYRSKSRIEKVKLIGSIYALGGYANCKPWSFGRKAFLKDIVISQI